METTTEHAVNRVTVQDIMNQDVTTVHPDDPINKIMALFGQKAISGIPVVNSNDELVGMVSEYDIITKRGHTVHDIMTHGVISVTADATAEYVAEIIGIHGVRQIPVVTQGRLIGIVSRGDLVQLCSRMRWICDDCDMVERAFLNLERCPDCGSANIHLDSSFNINE